MSLRAYGFRALGRKTCSVSGVGQTGRLIRWLGVSLVIAQRPFPQRPTQGITATKHLFCTGAKAVQSSGWCLLIHRTNSRFGNSNLHQRDSRSALFEGYTGAGADNRRPVSTSPSRPGVGGGYGYGYPSGSGSGTPTGGPTSGHLGVGKGSYRPATPNSRYVAAQSHVADGSGRAIHQGG